MSELQGDCSVLLGVAEDLVSPNGTDDCEHLGVFGEFEARGSGAGATDGVERDREAVAPTQHVVPVQSRSNQTISYQSSSG